MKAVLILMFAASFIGCLSYAKLPDNKTANKQPANDQIRQSANEKLPENAAQGDQTANLGDDFVLKKNEAAAIKSTKLHLKMLSAGQAQMEEGGDRPFCEFEIKNGDDKSQKTTLFVGKTTRVGNLIVKLNSVDTKTDPKADAPWSANSCGFVVTRK